MMWTNVLYILIISYLTFINADEYMKREFSLVKPYFGKCFVSLFLSLSLFRLETILQSCLRFRSMYKWRLIFRCRHGKFTLLGFYRLDIGYVKLYSINTRYSVAEWCDMEFSGKYTIKS